MRAFTATVALALALLAAQAAAQATAATAATAAAAKTPQSALDSALNAGMHQASSSSGAYVSDLTSGITGSPLYESRDTTGREPASVEKVYTSSTALLRMGPTARLQTDVYGVGRLSSTGVWTGDLYLRGGGDPTFGWAAFDKSHYGTGATVQQLVKHLLTAEHIKSINGRIIGDESYFDSLRGEPASGYKPDIYLEGELSALAFDRGWANSSGTAYQPRPALYATQQFTTALRQAHVSVPSGTPVYTGKTPHGAKLLASVHSPTTGTLIKLENTPSDNFFAETLLKDLGARFGGGGTTARGAAVVRAELASEFGIHPRIVDGSGLSSTDSTSPLQVVDVLTKMSSNSVFTGSLAIAGETGTLATEMNGTDAQGKCRGKTGTLHNASNLVGYCDARDGQTLAFAFLMNNINPIYAHPIQDRMVEAVAGYDG